MDSLSRQTGSVRWHCACPAQSTQALCAAASPSAVYTSDVRGAGRARIGATLKPRTHPTPIGEAHVRRHLDSNRQVLIAQGQFDALFDGYLVHAKRWQESPDPLLAVMMRQALAGAVLYLSCRPLDEVVGWTLRIADPHVELFVTGDVAASFVTGRVLPSVLHDDADSRLVVQASRPHLGVSQSVIDVSDLDVLQVFDQFCSRSEQTHARFFEHDDGRFSMLMGLPGCDAEWLDTFERGGVGPLSDDATDLDVRLFRFSCGCTAERLREVIRASEDLEDLFGSAESIEVLCPRCGHRWRLTRADLED